MVSAFRCPGFWNESRGSSVIRLLLKHNRWQQDRVLFRPFQTLTLRRYPSVFLQTRVLDRKARYNTTCITRSDAQDVIRFKGKGESQDEKEVASLLECGLSLRTRKMTITGVFSSLVCDCSSSSNSNMRDNVRERRRRRRRRDWFTVSPFHKLLWTCSFLYIFSPPTLTLPLPLPSNRYYSLLWQKQLNWTQLHCLLVHWAWCLINKTSMTTQTSFNCTGTMCKRTCSHTRAKRSFWQYWLNIRYNKIVR